MTGNTAKVTKGMNFVQAAVQRPSINVGRGNRLISKINLLQINNLKAKRASHILSEAFTTFKNEPRIQIYSIYRSFT